MESVNERMRVDEEELFKKEPRVNVISKETYEERVEKVFKLLHNTLAKSFGPYGAPTLIYNYPYSHVTKDGFTIMKNLSMDSSDQLVDQAIANMASDICGRLNFAVGDGTTSAVIATYSVYNNYLKYKNTLEQSMILPRDIIYTIRNIKNDIIKYLHKYVKSIRSEDPEELYNNIYKVVYISSNGDGEISDYIASLYKELKFPGISCELAADGKSKKRLIDGFKFDLVLNDKLYINSDNETMDCNNADVIILSVKITKDVYDNILKPLNEHSRARGRKLIVCASVYDETTLTSTIRRDLMNEYQKTKNINMVLCTCRSTSEYLRTRISDFATLCNTVVIDRALKSQIYERLDSGEDIIKILNIDGRTDIPNLTVMASTSSGAGICNISDVISKKYQPLFTDYEDSIRIGYVGSASIGLKNSTFSNFYYNENQYEALVKDAKLNMIELEDRYKKLGTFNLVVNQAQQRYYSLQLKMGVIEVGGDSELSQKLLKDSVDDAIRAAASAYDHGIILGCNVHLITAIYDFLDELSTKYHDVDDKTNFIMYTVLNIMRDGFCDVYRTVLSNAFPDKELASDKSLEEFRDILKQIFGKDILPKVFDDHYKDIVKAAIKRKNMFSNTENCSFTLHDFIIETSIHFGWVFDVSSKSFSTDVINSTQTDEEILLATIDLIALLITGNQMLITQKHNF